MVDQKAGSWSARYKFTGKEEDAETGLYYFVARYYGLSRCEAVGNPRISLWYGVDPMTEKYPSWNASNYTMNNPIRFIDPNGMDPSDSDGGGDPKKQEPPVPQTPPPATKQDPYAPPAGRGSELVKNLPRQEPGPIKFNQPDRPLNEGDNVDLSNFIPGKIVVSGSIKVIGTAFLLGALKDGSKEILEEGAEKGLKNLSNKWLPNVSILKQIPGQLKGLRSTFNVKGFDIDKLVEMTPSELENFVNGKEGAKKVFQQINKALQDGGHYYK